MVEKFLVVEQLHTTSADDGYLRAATLIVELAGTSAALAWGFNAFTIFAAGDDRARSVAAIDDEAACCD